MMLKRLLLLPTALLLLSGANVTSADDTHAASSTLQERTNELSWRDFRRKFSAFPQVTSSMSHDGVIRLYGYVHSRSKSTRIETLANQVRGSTGIRNRLTWRRSK